MSAFFSRVLSILEILVDSYPIFGPSAVDGVPVLGSILNKVKPVAIVESIFFAASLYILTIPCQVLRRL